MFFPSVRSPLRAIQPGLRPSQPCLRPSQPCLRPRQPDLRPSQPASQASRLRHGWLGLQPGWIAQKGKWTDGKSSHSTGLCPLSKIKHGRPIVANIGQGALMEVRSLFGLNSVIKTHYRRTTDHGPRTDGRTDPNIESLVRD